MAGAETYEALVVRGNGVRQSVRDMDPPEAIARVLLDDRAVVA